MEYQALIDVRSE